MVMDNFAENIRDKSPPVTDPETLAVALSNVGTMSPRLRKLYDDAAALLRAQAAQNERLRALIRECEPAVYSQHMREIGSRIAKPGALLARVREA